MYVAGRRSTPSLSEIFRSQGADFLRGVAKMILRDRRSTSYDPASFFVAGALL